MSTRDKIIFNKYKFYFKSQFDKVKLNLKMTQELVRVVTIFDKPIFNLTNYTSIYIV